MIMKKYRELILGIAMLLIAIVYGASTTQINVRVAMSFTACYVPYMLAVLCLVLGIFQSIRGVRYARAYAASEGGEREPGDGLSVFLVFLTIVVYAALLRSIGFLLDTIVLTFILMLLLCPKSRRKPVLFAVISVVSTVAIYYLFRNGLHLMLPKGILG